MLNISDSISFQDVLLMPKHNSYLGEISTNININLGESIFNFSQPFVPSNSFTITDIKMAIALISKNSLAIFHDGSEYYRLSYSEEYLKLNLLKSLKEIQDVCINILHKPDYNKYLGVSVGTKTLDYEIVSMLYENNIRIFCVENINGDSNETLAMIEFIRKLDSQNLIIGGNVVSGRAAKELWLSGANIVKIGNSMNMELYGTGIPLLSSLIDCSSQKSRGEYLMCDGPISSSGDLVKALCFSDFVMSKKLFQGTFEAPTCSSNISLESTLKALLESILIAARMQNVSSLRELQDNVNLIKLTSSGILEGRNI